MASIEERAAALALDKTESAEAALREKRQKYTAEIKRHSPATWLYKRGGTMKTWKKRFCCIEHGILYYYVSEKDKQLGKPALGALVLKNSEARRPTSLGSKGKYKHTCFRIDLDESAQMQVVEGTASVKGGGGKDDDDDDVADAKGRLGKSKWLFAAEDGPSVQQWMTDISWWSVQGQEVSSF